MKTLARAIRIAVALLVVMLPCSLPAAAQDAVRHLFYEAVATGGAASPYQTRKALTEQVQAEIVPAVLSILTIPADAVHTELRMGGYLRETNPALHSAVRDGDTIADRLALALGWTLRQESVLVSDLNERAGSGNGTGTGYAVIAFPPDSLTPELAQRFFLAAAAIQQGLGGGYTAFGDRLLFLNLRDSDGRAYSGLDDGSFVVALGQAVAAFPGASLAGSGTSAARLVEGADAPKTLGSHLIDRLAPLRNRYDSLVSRFLSSSSGKTAP